MVSIFESLLSKTLMLCVCVYGARDLIQILRHALSLSNILIPDLLHKYLEIQEKSKHTQETTDILSVAISIRLILKQEVQETG